MAPTPTRQASTNPASISDKESRPAGGNADPGSNSKPSHSAIDNKGGLGWANGR